MWWRTATAVHDSERNEEAIETIDIIIEKGMGTYSLYYSKAVLYQRLDRFSEAREAYNKVMELFGSNYEIYKRLAFLEADRQMSLINEERDYKSFKEYYNRAFELYNGLTDAQADVEMDSLEVLYNDIKAGGWFEE